jgi:hypothetical protein
MATVLVSEHKITQFRVKVTPLRVDAAALASSSISGTIEYCINNAID